MSVRDRKANIFGRISSFRTFLDSYPQLYEINSWKSINLSGGQIEFMIDLFSALGSTEELQNAIAQILLDKLDVIEQNVKDGLKRSLKSNICCNINPSLMKQPFYFSISEFDLLNLFQINPQSPAGKSSYFDVNTGVNSKDMNVFLHSVITNRPDPAAWFQFTPTSEYPQHLRIKNSAIARFTFHETFTIPNDGITRDNVVEVEVNPNYGISGAEYYRNLNDWTDDYIDSVKFFDKEAFVAQLMGKIFGAYGGLGLSTEQIVLQEQIETILDRLSDCQDGYSGESDDSFFTFDNAAYSLMVETAEKKKVGLYEYDRSTDTAVQITLDDITKAFEGLDQTASLEERKVAFDTGMNSIMDQAAGGNSNINENDRLQFKRNLLKNLLNELSLAFGMLLVSPKVYMVILVNMRLMGITDNFDVISFLRSNLNLVNDVVGAIKDAVLQQLMNEIKIMLRRLAKGIAKEMINDNKIKFRKTLRGLMPFGNIGGTIIRLGSTRR